MKGVRDVVPCFRTPLQLDPGVRIVERSVFDELDADGSKGGRSLYEQVLGRRNVITGAEYAVRHPVEITTNTAYLRDTQTFLAEKLPVIRPLDPRAVRLIEDIKAHSYDYRNYGFLEMRCLRWLNDEPVAMQLLFAHRLGAPVVGLSLPLILLFLPFVALRVQDIDCTFDQYWALLKQALHRHGLGKVLGVTSDCGKERLYAIAAIAMYAFQTWQNIVGCKSAHTCVHQAHDVICHTRDYLRAAREALTAMNANSAGLQCYSAFATRNAAVIKVIDSFLERSGNVSRNSGLREKCVSMGDVLRSCWALKQDDTLRRAVRYASDALDYYSQVQCAGHALRTGAMRRCRFTTKTTRFGAIALGCVASDERVCNDVSLSRPILLTGPNASGKTTLLKAVATNVILCQQFGTGFFRKARINPYERIHCYITIPDTSDRDSLFEAEARRCKSILAALGRSSDRQLCVFDELYSGTNPREATAACIAYVEALATSPNASAVVTTHLHDVCDCLADSLVRKTQMIVDESGAATYSATQGVSRTNNALTTLRAMDYPEETLRRAEEVLHSMGPSTFSPPSKYACPEKRC